MVEALDGAPGVYTADWAETPEAIESTLANTAISVATQPRLSIFRSSLFVTLSSNTSQAQGRSPRRIHGQVLPLVPSR